MLKQYKAGGTQKEYIFKDGAFVNGYSATTNTFSISGGLLVKDNYSGSESTIQLNIPFSKSGYRFYIEFNMAYGDYAYDRMYICPETSSAGTGICVWSHYMSTGTTGFVISMVSNSAIVIRLNMSGSSSSHNYTRIKTIWAEKIS